jgi:formate dehydrogenase subunit gamma
MTEEKILRYTRVQRAYHWLTLLTLSVLFFSGLAIYKPDPFAFGMQTSRWFLYPTYSFWFGWHILFAFVLLVSGGFHIVYDTLILRRGWDIWFEGKDWKNLKMIAANWVNISKEYPKYTKYHPMQKFLHWGIFGVLLLIGITGFVMWEPTRYRLFPWWATDVGIEFICDMHIIHQFLTFAIITMIILHFTFSALSIHNWPISKSMITGYVPAKWFYKYHRATSSERSIKE